MGSTVTALAHDVLIHSRNFPLNYYSIMAIIGLGVRVCGETLRWM